MPFRIVAPGIGYARPGRPVFRSNVRTVSMSAAYSVLPEIALPSGWFSVRPSRVTPIHLLVLHAAIRVDQRHEAVVRRDVLRVGGVHRDDHVAGGIERAALGEVEAAVDLHVARHRHLLAGFVRGAERLPAWNGFGAASAAGAGCCECTVGASDSTTVPTNAGIVLIFTISPGRKNGPRANHGRSSIGLKAPHGCASCVDGRGSCAAVW